MFGLPDLSYDLMTRSKYEHIVEGVNENTFGKNKLKVLFVQYISSKIIKVKVPLFNSVSLRLIVQILVGHYFGPDLKSSRF